MRHIEAANIADKFVSTIRPYCARVEVAGSIRRGQLTVKDIEIVLIPKIEEVLVPMQSLFEEESLVMRNQLHHWATRTDIVRPLQWIKPNTPAIIPWHVNADGLYWRGYFPKHGIKCDIFIATPLNWGYILAIRTGSEEFSKALVSRCRAIKRICDNGMMTVNGEPYPTPEESDFFALAGVKHIDAEARRYKHDVWENKVKPRYVPWEGYG